VTQRTKELEDSNSRLRQIDETRRKFFSNVSHELRTPVTVLLGEAEVTLRSKQASLEDMKKAMGRIIANGGFLRRRLNDLLNLARSDDGEIKLDMKPAVVNEIVDDAVSTARAYALANDVELSFLSTDEDLIANLDESWFRQSVLVLIDNAVKFSKPDDIIKITLEENSGKALIKVIDEGPGIEEEALDHLFERYYQAKEGQKREGTGLGLAIAHWIITGHNGKIWAENVSNAEKQNMKQELNVNNGTQTGAIMNVEVELIE
jgi:signal transduction histidine kinase